MQTVSRASESTKAHNLDAVVRQKLKQAILTGALPSGTHLSETKLAKAYGVSRTPIREALCALTAAGLTEMIPNRGTFVRTPTHKETQDTQTLYSHLMALAGRLACKNLAETDFARLEQAMADMTHPSSHFEQARLNVHAVICKAADMANLTSMLSQLEEHLALPLLAQVASAADATTLQQSYNYFLTALKRQKPETAEKALKEAITFGFSIKKASDQTSDAA